MKLPAPLPEHLERFESAEGDEELLEQLKGHPADLVLFFEHACLDETWSKKEHALFMRLVMDWMDKKVLNDELHITLVERIAEAIHHHARNLQHLIPTNLKVILTDREVVTNSLLLSAGSRYLYDLVRDECRGEENPEMNFNINYHLFEAVEDFVYFGRARKLWMRERDDIIEVLRQALAWDIHGLYDECQKVLERYIELKNVFDTLVHADDEGWIILKGDCIEFINDLQYGVRLQNRNERGLTLRFLNFGQRALETFRKLNDRVTHFVFAEKQVEEPLFLKLLEEATHLRGVDLSETENFVANLHQLPKNLQDLTLSNCFWLDPKTFQSLINICPTIMHLYMPSNPQLDINMLVLLQKLSKLETLDVARCEKLGNEEMKVIVEARPKLIELSVAGCSKLKEDGFLTIARSLSDLLILDLSSTGLRDGALLEIVERCRELKSLNVSRCRELSGEAIVKAVRMAPALREITFANCDLREEHLVEMRRSKPMLAL